MVGQTIQSPTNRQTWPPPQKTLPLPPIRGGRWSRYTNNYRKIPLSPPREAAWTMAIYAELCMGRGSVSWGDRPLTGAIVASDCDDFDLFRETKTTNRPECPTERRYRACPKIMHFRAPPPPQSSLGGGGAGKS